jgi:hypothetical protein
MLQDGIRLPAVQGSDDDWAAGHSQLGLIRRWYVPILPLDTRERKNQTIKLEAFTGVEPQIFR